MLTPEQATQIASQSIRRAAGREPTSAYQSLEDLGLSAGGVERLALAVKEEVQVFGHWLEPNLRHLVQSLSPSMTVGDFEYHVMQLSSGKLCSGPDHHPQTFPFPDKCPQCRYPV